MDCNALPSGLKNRAISPYRGPNGPETAEKATDRPLTGEGSNSRGAAEFCPFTVSSSGGTIAVPPDAAVAARRCHGRCTANARRAEWRTDLWRGSSWKAVTWQSRTPADGHAQAA